MACNLMGYKMDLGWIACHLMGYKIAPIHISYKFAGNKAETYRYV